MASCHLSNTHPLPRVENADDEGRVNLRGEGIRALVLEGQRGRSGEWWTPDYWNPRFGRMFLTTSTQYDLSVIDVERERYLSISASRGRCQKRAIIPTDDIYLPHSMPRFSTLFGYAEDVWTLHRFECLFHCLRVLPDWGYRLQLLKGVHRIRKS